MGGEEAPTPGSPVPWSVLAWSRHAELVGLAKGKEPRRGPERAEQLDENLESVMSNREGRPLSRGKWPVVFSVTQSSRNIMTARDTESHQW